MAISDEHGRGDEAVPAVDCWALLIVLVVGARVRVGGQDLAVGRLVPPGGGSSVVMRPLCSIALLIIVGIKVLQATRQA